MWNEINHIASPFLGASLIIFNIMSAVTIVFLEKRKPNSSWAWIMLLFFLPYLGFIVYLILGRSIYRQKIFPFSKHEKIEFQKSILNQETPYCIQDSELLLSQYESLIEQNYITEQSFLCRNNELKIFTTGEDKFKALFEDIENAKHCIYVQYYIFKKDIIGQKLCERLKKKQRKGVQVYLLYDDIGSRGLSIHKLKDLTEVGVQVRRFFKSKLPLINLRLNNRNHRKIVVIDGKIGYIGGFNVGDEYLGKDPYIGFWRDTHIRVTGDSAQALAYHFLDDWNAELLNEGNHHYLHPDIIPPLLTKPTQEIPIQLVSSGPNTPKESIKMAFLKMIMSAKHHIYLQTPYFVPDDSIMDALKVALYSGVNIHIMIPKMTDQFLVQWANMAYIKDMIKLGAKVYLYHHGFLHAKMLMIDDNVSSIGSANFDTRSFHLNFETNAFIYDRKTALELKEIFTKDIEQCFTIDDKWLESCSRLDHLKEGVAKLISPIL